MQVRKVVLHTAVIVGLGLLHAVASIVNGVCASMHHGDKAVPLQFERVCRTRNAATTTEDKKSETGRGHQERSEERNNDANQTSSVIAE